MLRRTGLLAVLTLAMPLPLVAADETPIPAIIQAWEGWVTAQGDPNTILAVARAGELVHEDARGVDLDVADHVGLASNSKAITAACIASLVREGAVRWDTTLREIDGLDVPSGASADISIGALMAQTSGLDRDSTQLRMNFWLNETEPRHADVSERALARGPTTEATGSYFYTNENYAILGRVIELVEGDYTEACSDRVLAPAGADGALSEKYGAFAAWGGWSMSMADYLGFLHEAVPEDPVALPHATIREDALYGQGLLFRETEDGPVFWHAGMLCFLMRGHTFTYAAVYENGWSVSVWADACPDAEARAQLDTALWAATHPD